jgi:type IV pilus assembly protein PilO
VEKNKRDLMILIAILFLGMNYGIYTYFITKQLDNVKVAQNRYLVEKQKLDNIKAKKQSIDDKEKVLQKLKQETANFDNIVSNQINTPQLIYDFYNGCKSFGVTGENVSFQLLNNVNNSDNKTSNNTNTANNTNGTNSNKNTNTNNSNISINNTDKANNQNFYSLTINLNITGDKGNVENFIKNLGVITKRKLNVKSITISSVGNNGVLSSSNNQINIPSVSIPNINVQSGTNMQNQPSVNNGNSNSAQTSLNESGNAQVNTSQLAAQIVFYQYIENNENNTMNVSNNYEFYDSKEEGFNSISDMFK